MEQKTTPFADYLQWGAAEEARRQAEAFELAQMRVAMRDAVAGGATRPSKSGRSIIFAAPTRGRHDLSGRLEEARLQMASAGLAWQHVTEAEVGVLRQAEDEEAEREHLKRLHVIVTKPYRVERGNELVVHRTVVLKGLWDVVAMSSDMATGPRVALIAGMIEGVLQHAPEHLRAGIPVLVYESEWNGAEHPVHPEVVAALAARGISNYVEQCR